ncbi:MAG: hypothetical protein NC084_06585 [Bacteroides sp.]|nr:hypothetical protein [Eubacterium sp.]MCM1418253.1 hypothetical protein [Roseburia sp.]MCM1462365.1 hypothetical protein [Bacteroides sp.]
MDRLKEIFRKKRAETNEHIRQLEREGRAGVRYTITLANIPFFILAVISDVGWLLQLIFGIIYLRESGLKSLPGLAVLIDLICVIFGAVYISYLNKIREKGISTRLQKNLGFGTLMLSGLAGGMIGIFTIAFCGVSSPFIFMAVGGFLNFAACLPIFLLFKKGIVYGVE